jgi:threonine dehydratase
VRTVICAIGGGGLITGVGSAIKARKPEREGPGAEPETAAPYALSLREGGPRKFTDWQASSSTAPAAKSVHRADVGADAPVADGAITVTLDQTRQCHAPHCRERRGRSPKGWRTSLAAALSGDSLEGPIVCVVSGSNIDLGKFAELVAT